MAQYTHRAKERMAMKQFVWDNSVRAWRPVKQRRSTAALKHVLQMLVWRV